MGAVFMIASGAGFSQVMSVLQSLQPSDMVRGNLSWYEFCAGPAVAPPD